jgi:dihydroxy-acid dehydratase
MSKEPKKPRRSQISFGGALNGFTPRSWMRASGLPENQFDGRPVIGICNTWSDLNPCNIHFRELAQHVRAGILEAGGFPVEFPSMSLGENLMQPTTMLYRNLASMEVEESIRGNPLDGVVLLMGCDKTTPALMMGAASVNLPTIGVSGGPKLNGKMRGKELGVADLWKAADDLRGGKIGLADVAEMESCVNRSNGHCNIMGTASTMACMIEALGVGLPGNAAIPAVDARRTVLARLAGRRIVELVKEDVKLSDILTRAAFENAIRVNAAIGGSTNAILHVTAIARRIGVELNVEDWDKLARPVPTMVSLQPNGPHMMEDFYEAGGLPPVLRQLGEHDMLHRDCMTVNGQTIWQTVENAPAYRPEVISSYEQPFKRNSGLAVLKGNLCPKGAVIKPSAADPKLLKHKGRAIVFESFEDLQARIDDENLDVDASCVLVLKNCGPRGFPGMPEVGNFKLPKKILQQGVRDMVRISDARMSGTAFGTIVLHASPEAAVGGALALVRDGDVIELDVEARSLQLNVSDEELAKRRAEWTPTQYQAARGYTKLYVDTVNQASDGVDLDFLVGCSGPDVKYVPDAH